MEHMKYQVMPDLTPIEYEALKADIEERGVLVPVEVDECGAILDGHHRVKAWAELRGEGVNLPDYPRMVRKGLTEEQKRNHARSLNVLRRHLSREQREEVMRAMRADGMTYQEIADKVGVSVYTAHSAARDVELLENKKLIGADGKARPASYERRAEVPSYSAGLFVPGDAVDLDRNAAERVAKQAQQERNGVRRQERIDRIVTISQGNSELGDELDGQYPVIYADPPWRYEHVKTDNRRIENHYPTMDLDEICALPVSDIATPDSVLFLWTTSPKLAESMRVIEAWGYTYRTCMVWDKDRIGMGYYARQQHELLLIATRGSVPVPEPENRPPSVIRIRRDDEHSSKPTEFYTMIERMYPELRKLELFARNRRNGWAAWGNQA